MILHTDGRILGVDCFWKDFAALQRTEDDAFPRLETLTQQEHPFLGQPWYYLHPCRTAELMTSAGLADAGAPERYMTAWMSTVLPLFSCPVANDYAIQLRPETT